MRCICDRRNETYPDGALVRVDGDTGVVTILATYMNSYVRLSMALINSN